MFYPLKNFEGIYEISLTGIVRSTLIRRAKSGRTPSGKPLRQILSRSGYYQIYLRKTVNRASQKPFFIHRLIAINFIPNPENKPCINHINSIRTDNSIANLEWVTYSENNKHAYKFGNQIRTFGESHNQTKLKENQVLEIRSKYSFRIYTLKRLSKEFNISVGAVQAIVERKTWKHI